MPDPIDGSSGTPPVRKPVLPYQSSLPTSAVTIRKFRDVYEAQLYANELAGHGIDYYLMNQNTNDVLGAYAAFTMVELQVREQDVEQASAILANLEINPLDVEPAEAADPDQPLPDPAGNGTLVTAAVFDNPRSLFDAAATLGAARIESFLPALVARGDRPQGVGKRFILRVRQEDAQRASDLLQRAGKEEADEDEPRCPQCGSYRVLLVPQVRAKFIDFLLGRRTQELMECLRCHHQWPV